MLLLQDDEYISLVDFLMLYRSYRMVAAIVMSWGSLEPKHYRAYQISQLPAQTDGRGVGSLSRQKPNSRLIIGRALFDDFFCRQ